MARRERSLSARLVDWLRARVELAKISLAPAPRWPPTETVVAALHAGSIELALQLEDDPHARYQVIQQLAPSNPHLWLARDLSLGREVVLKLERCDSSEGTRALAWEGSLAARLRHPHIVTLHEAGPGYLVFERLDGDLSAYMGHEPSLVLDALAQAGRGLAALHAQGICHGDIKPENVLVNVERGADGAVARLWAKLGDLGAAHHAQLPTATGQRAGCKLADLRAFAETVWECLTGGLRPPRGQELIPGELHALLGSTFMPGAGQRWADITALVDAMERGRGATAARQSSFEANAQCASSFDEALACAQDGHFAMAALRWRTLRASSGLSAAELGRAGFTVAAAMLAAARATGQTLGFSRAVELLHDAMACFERAGDELGVAEVRGALAEACGEWMSSYPIDSEEHQQLAALIQELRPTNHERD